MDQFLFNEEIEIKLELSSFAEYLKLLGFIGHPDNEFCQRNFFYDSVDNRLSKEKITLRVRQDPEYGIVSLKGEATYLAQAAIRAETETHIELNITNDIIQGGKRYLKFGYKTCGTDKEKIPRY